MHEFLQRETIMGVSTLLTFIFLSVANAQTATNTTFAGNSTQCPTPNIPGFLYKEDCKLICRDTHWTDILLFFLGNYAAHAATVISKPGQSPLAGVVAIITALLFPGGGIRTGVDAIMSRAQWGKTNLQIACRAGAICAVVEVDPRLTDFGTEGGNGETSRVASLQSVQPEGRAAYNMILLTVYGRTGELPQYRAVRIHGYASLPDRYALMIVPPRSTFCNDHPASRDRESELGSNYTTATNLSCSYNIVKIFISIAQVLFSISTLYRTRGDQVTRYSYAAFGLTTVPYAWMSLVNLVGNAICPQYESVYIVGSSGLDDFREELETMGKERRGSLGVTGEVGRLTPEADANLVATYERFRDFGVVEEPRKNLSIWMVSLFLNPVGSIHAVIAAIPIAVVGGLTGFKPGESALYQRVWVMLWLVMGYLFASIRPAGAVLEGRPLVRGKVRREHFHAALLIQQVVVYAAVAIGGYVVVAQMLLEFGVCSLNKAIG